MAKVEVNILFVEREPSLRRMVKDMLENAGATLIERLPGSGDLPDAVSLALIDDVVAIGEVKAMPLSPPVIALVASADMVALSRAAGADEVLVEPVSMTALFEAIGRYLPAS